MKIQMLSTAAGPAGTFLTGQILQVGADVSPLQAKAFLEGGYARKVEGDPVQQKPAPVMETAMVEPVAEKAVAPAMKGKPKGKAK